MSRRLPDLAKASRPGLFDSTLPAKIHAAAEIAHEMKNAVHGNRAAKPSAVV